MKGSFYFLIKEKGEEEVVGNVFFLFGFDFIREVFELCLEVLYFFDGYEEYFKVLLVFREEKFVVLFWDYIFKMEIWIIDRVEFNVVLWNKLLVVNMVIIIGLSIWFMFGGVNYLWMRRRKW